MNTAALDLLAIGAHPDDVELFAGGLIAAAVARGQRVGIAHLTRGELGTRGSAEIRTREATEAARILGLDPDRQLAFLDLGDTLIENTEVNRLAVVHLLRAWRPRVVLFPHPEDRHPDHGKTHRLVRDALFYSHLPRVAPGQSAHRPEAHLLFQSNTPPAHPADVIVDITATFERKLAAIQAYRSQFHNTSALPDSVLTGEQTFISTPEFLAQIEIRARFYGGLIGVRYGEPYHLDGPVAVGDVVGLLTGGSPRADAS
jgi:bacillithiol biosynthesis deacetylase BshB1